MNDPDKETSYDKVPYESQPYPQSHPDRLATLGRLFGLSPTAVSQCRVLELGCAGGGNLIPMAYHLPQSEFVGVDLSKRQVEMGHKVVGDLGLRNIQLKHSSILDVDASWGVFDYIISHGVFSWVPDEVQGKILAISSANLSPQGIAYVSYNTYPGWHIREMIRHMMLFHASQFDTSTERIEQARALMDFLSRSVPTEGNYYGTLLKHELELIRGSRDWYLYHDHLEEVNAPVYFHQFVELADSYGLQYVGEADFAAMLTTGFPEEVEETLKKISRHIVHAEQYMDFVRNRHFRQTLLCHKEHTLKRDLGSDEVRDLLAASAASPSAEPVDLSAGIEQSFRIAGGASVKTPFPLTKAALLILRERWPRALDLHALSKEAQRRLQNAGILNDVDEDECRKRLARDFLHCYSANLTEFHTWQADFVAEVEARPKVSELAAYQVRHERPVVNQRHELVKLDPVSKQLVLMLDGGRDQAALLTRLHELVEDGTLEVRQEGTRLRNGNELTAALTESLEQALYKLARAALLVK